MSNDNRAPFEAAMRYRRYTYFDGSWCGPEGAAEWVYKSAGTQHAWIGWQAARKIDPTPEEPTQAEPVGPSFTWTDSSGRQTAASEESAILTELLAIGDVSFSKLPTEKFFVTMRLPYSMVWWYGTQSTLLESLREVRRKAVHMGKLKGET